MSEIGDAFAKEIEALERVRDELKVQLHLARAEAKDEWNKLESKWEDLQSKLPALKQASQESVHQLSGTMKELLDELRQGYKRVKDAI